MHKFYQYASLNIIICNTFLSIIDFWRSIFVILVFIIFTSSILAFVIFDFKFSCGLFSYLCSKFSGRLFKVYWTWTLVQNLAGIELSMTSTFLSRLKLFALMVYIIDNLILKLFQSLNFTICSLSLYLKMMVALFTFNIASVG